MKIFITVFGMMFASVALAESYLYWMTGDAPGVEDFDSIKISARTANIEGTLTHQGYLTLGWNNSGTFETLSTDGSMSATMQQMDEYREGGFGFYAALSTYAAEEYSYVIEIYLNDTLVGESSTLGYTTGVSNGYIQAIDAQIKSLASAWTPTVPEPNSVLMMLIGCAALALRRRKTLHA